MKIKLPIAVVFAATGLALAGCEGSDNGNIDIASAIPDPVFKEYCISQMGEWDTDGDGALSGSEAAAVKKIDLGNEDDWEGERAASLKGIEAFTGIKELYCHNSALTELDLSKNRELVYLNCRGNDLKRLNVAGLSKLGRLWCRDNALEALDLAGCTALVDLDCARNAIAALDVTNCPLVTLGCELNALASLDISANTALVIFYCSGNPGSGGIFPVMAWFDNENVPSKFTVEAWTLDGATIAPSYGRP
jgi:hypothetical protein